MTPEKSREVPQSPALERINAALMDGAVVRGFRSGGGLRVVRVEKGDELIGYGEHPHVEKALSLADQDLLTRASVHSKKSSYYLTGSSTASSFLDGWLLRGNSFRAERTDDNKVIMQLKGLFLFPPEILEEIQQTVRAGAGVIDAFVDVTKTGKGNSFEEALAKVTAPVVAINLQTA